MTKPSDKITKHANNIFNDKQEYVCFVPISKLPFWVNIEAIVKYLDEEEKPKYACPNCHRVVDELFSCIVVDILVDGKISTIDYKCAAEKGILIKGLCEPRKIYKCKHCLNEN